jgi:hypothetical protein
VHITSLGHGDVSTSTQLTKPDVSLLTEFTKGEQHPIKVEQSSVWRCFPLAMWAPSGFFIKLWFQNYVFSLISNDNSKQ